VIELATGSAPSTREVAAAVAALARPGDLIVLVGELGAGKTTFAQGFGAALGVDEPVTSPTFTLTRVYEGRLVMNHVDVYRLERLGEVIDLALPELLDGGGVTLVEWGDAIRAALPRDYLEVHLRFAEPSAGEPLAAEDSFERRRLSLRVVGPSWQPRLRRLTDALEAWRC
jgi:tRNA threonylcarbamoyladenosine biosynthesis protein TsaE